MTEYGKKVKTVPKANREGNRIIIYDEIVKQFLDSNAKYWKLFIPKILEDLEKQDGKKRKTKNIFNVLNSRAKKGGFKVIQRDKQIYLIRLDSTVNEGLP